MALPSSKFTAVTLGVVGVVALGSVTFNQMNKEDYTPSVVNPDTTVVGDGRVEVKCTGTGGNVKVSGGAKYDTCIIAPQLTDTGSIQTVELEIIAAPANVNIDCGFVKGTEAGTGTAFTNFNNKASGTGARIVFSTGSLRWNSVDYVKCGTLTNPTSAFDAVLRVDYRDDYSE